jgi:hypothetical protein
MRQKTLRKNATINMTEAKETLHDELEEINLD